MTKPLRCAPKLLKKDLTDRVYIVTGSNSGIGLATARQLAKQGAHVVLACRRVDAAKALLPNLKQEAPSGSFEVLRLDLGDKKSIHEFAKAFLGNHDKLHGLVNNAGVMNTPKGKTKDGFETQLGINHLGHFLLTGLLLERLKDSAPSRIVNISSCYHDKAVGKTGLIHFDDPHFKKRPYNGWEAYAQSKLANVLHAKELGRRLADSGVTAVSVHPGWVRTDLIRHSMPVWLQDSLLRPVFHLIGMINPVDGAQTTLHCLLDEQVVHQSGEYFSQRGMYRDKACNKGGWPLRSPNPEVHKTEVAQKLWEWSEESVGLLVG